MIDYYFDKEETFTLDEIMFVLYHLFKNYHYYESKIYIYS